MLKFKEKIASTWMILFMKKKKVVQCLRLNLVCKCQRDSECGSPVTLTSDPRQRGLLCKLGRTRRKMVNSSN